MNDLRVRIDPKVAEAIPFEASHAPVPGSSGIPLWQRIGPAAAGMADSDDLRHSNTPAPTSGIHAIPIPSFNASDTQAKISALVAAIAEKEKERGVHNNNSNNIVPPTSDAELPKYFNQPLSATSDHSTLAPVPNPLASGSFAALLRSIQAMNNSQSLSSDRPPVAAMPIEQFRDKILPVILKNAQRRSGFEDKSMPEVENRLREALTDDVCRALSDKFEAARRERQAKRDFVTDPQHNATVASQSTVIGSISSSLSDLGIPTPPASAQMQDTQDLPKAPRAMRLGQLAKERALTSPTTSLPLGNSMGSLPLPPRPDDSRNGLDDTHRMHSIPIPLDSSFFPTSSVNASLSQKSPTLSKEGSFYTSNASPSRSPRRRPRSKGALAIPMKSGRSRSPPPPSRRGQRSPGRRPYSPPSRYRRSLSRPRSPPTESRPSRSRPFEGSISHRPLSPPTYRRRRRSPETSFRGRRSPLHMWTIDRTHDPAQSSQQDSLVRRSESPSSLNQRLTLSSSSMGTTRSPSPPRASFRHRLPRPVDEDHSEYIGMRQGNRSTPQPYSRHPDSGRSSLQQTPKLDYTGSAIATPVKAQASMVKPEPDLENFTAALHPSSSSVVLEHVTVPASHAFVSSEQGSLSINGQPDQPIPVTNSQTHLTQPLSVEGSSVSVKPSPMVKPLAQVLTPANDTVIPTPAQSPIPPSFTSNLVEVATNASAHSSVLPVMTLAPSASPQAQAAARIQIRDAAIPSPSQPSQALDVAAPPSDEILTVLKPHNVVPGIWFAKLGHDQADIVDYEFKVDAETAHRWRIPPSSSDSCKAEGMVAERLVLMLLCLPLEPLASVFQAESTPESFDVKAFASAVEGTQTAWPEQGTLLVQMNPTKTHSRSWFPEHMGPTSPGLDVTESIREGTNVLRLIQLDDMKDKVFILQAYRSCNHMYWDVDSSDLSTHWAAWNMNPLIVGVV